MTLLLLYGLISIFFSFLCSVLEAVLLSVTPTFINVKKKAGRPYALTLEELKRDVDKPLIAILTLNTIAHTVGAILVGVQAEKLPFKVDFFGINVVGIVSAIMTFLILVVSEIIPKTIGAKYWKQLAGFATQTLILMILPLKYSGILWLLQLTTRVIGGKGHEGSMLSREDFSAMTDIAEQEGVFEQSESNIIRNLINFRKVQTKNIMTPRSVMKTAHEKQTVEAFFNANPNLRFSRIPIYATNSDDITGQVLKSDILKEMAEGNGQKTLAEIKREILFTSRNRPIPALLDTLIESRHHLAVVVDEYGSVSGLVTIEDVVETLLGLEIVDETDREHDMQELARKNWEERAKRLGLFQNERNK